MAKQLVNPVERHAEKAVLGLTGLLLLGAIAVYLVTSPNQVELGGEQVTPRSIDSKVERKAESVRQQIRSQQPRPAPFSPVLDEFVRHLHGLDELALATPLPRALPIGPDVPFIDAPTVATEKARLVSVVPLGKPMTTSGRMLSTLVQEEGERKSPGSESPLDWVTVSAVFDRRGQRDLQQRAFGLKYADVFFGPAEVQRRERRLDGTWSDDDWETIPTWPSRSWEVPEITLVRDPKQVSVPREEYNRIEKFIERLTEPFTQLGCVRPLPPNEVPPRTWKFPVLTSLNDVAAQDDEYINPKDKPSPHPELVRYAWPEEGSARPKEGEKDAPTAGGIPEMFKEAERLLATARSNWKLDDAVKANNICIEISDDARASPSEIRRADQLQKKADQLMKDIKNLPPPAVAAAEASGGRELLPTQQLWAHDALPESLVNGRTYQYRMRPVILNRLWGIPEKLENPDDALTPFLFGEWSEPTDPVTIEPASRYFVTRADASKREISIEMYQWYRAVWVTTRMKLGIGQSVAIQDRVDVPDPQDPKTAWRAPVDFNGKAVVADADFDRRIRERKAERGGGVRMLPPERTTAVVFVDSDGQVHERFESLDRNDPVKKEMHGRVWKKPKESAEP